MRKDTFRIWKNILLLVAKDYYQAQIAESLGMKESTISHHVTNLEKKGLINCEVRTNYKILHITELGSKFLIINDKEYLKAPRELRSSKFEVHSKGTELESSNETSINTLPHFDNLHNIDFKIKIIKDAEIWLPNQAQLNGWVKKWDWFGDVYLQKNKDKSITVRFRIDDCRDNHWKATAQAYNIVLRLIERLQESYGIVLGLPVLARKPHYTIVKDPLAEKISHLMTFENEIGIIDRSNDTGHLELKSPEYVDEYFRTPMKLDKIQNHQDKERKRMNAVVGAIDDIRLQNDDIRMQLEQLKEPEKKKPKKPFDVEGYL